MEAVMTESVEGKAREYSMKNPKMTVHLYDPVESEVIIMKDGEDVKRMKAEVGTKAYKNHALDRKGVKTFNFDYSRSV